LIASSGIVVSSFDSVVLRSVAVSSDPVVRSERAHTLDLAAVGATRVDTATTGFPAGTSVSVDEVGSQGWTLDDLVPPVMVLRESAIAHNLDVMARYCREHGVELAPHGKTTMAPALWALQLAAGAWGITAATPVQARAMRAVGVSRILLANELVDHDAISWVAAELHDPDLWFACWIDSAEGVSLLRDGLRAAASPRPLRVLVELGHPGGRTGCRSIEEASALARTVAATPELELGGVAAFEGTICAERTSGCLAEVDAFLHAVRRVAEDVRPLVDGVMDVTAGGSALFDRVVDALAGSWADRIGARVVLRAGCYLTHDHGHYERISPLRASGTPFRTAIEVWGSVLSTPEPAVAVVGVGKRDAPFDIDLPMPRWIRPPGGPVRGSTGLSVSRLMDQHAICRVAGEPAPRLGDLVGFGISHPCSAFDRRRVIPLLDDADGVLGGIVTLF
jgi:D-serine deaminase-like pyridoxal phosphate-dependent protein